MMDSASQQAQDDLSGLLNTTLPFAQQMLAKCGEFYPFGATVTASGETRLLAGDVGQEYPANADVLSLLMERLRRDRWDLRAVAICSDACSQSQMRSGSSLSTSTDRRWLS